MNVQFTPISTDDVKRLRSKAIAAYGTGVIVPTENILEKCRSLLGDDQVDFVHVRPASNNCFHVRVDRG